MKSFAYGKSQFQSEYLLSSTQPNKWNVEYWREGIGRWIKRADSHEFQPDNSVGTFAEFRTLSKEEYFIEIL